MVRPGELDDLKQLATGWDVSLSAASWALLSDLLADLRGHRPTLSEPGLLLVAASRRILERSGIE